MTVGFEKVFEAAEECLFFWDVEDPGECMLLMLLQIKKNRHPIFGKGFATEKQICAKTGYSVEFVFEALRFLEEYGYVIRTYDEEVEIISATFKTNQKNRRENNIISIREYFRLKRLRAWRGF